MKQGFSKEVYKEVPCSKGCGRVVSRVMNKKKAICYPCRLEREKAYRDILSAARKKAKAELETKLIRRYEKYGSFLRRTASAKYD